jgi:hypothetical protein
MLLGAAKTLASILIVTLIACAFARATCSVDVVMVRGRVDHAPSDAKVRVQLIYSGDVAGESGEVTVEDGRFSIPIDFLTQSRRPVVNGILEKVWPQTEDCRCDISGKRWGTRVRSRFAGLCEGFQSSGSD